MFYKQEQIFLRVFFLVTNCEIHEHPQTGSLTQGYNPSATFYIQFVTCGSQKKMESTAVTLVQICFSSQASRNEEHTNKSVVEYFCIIIVLIFNT